MNEMNDIQEVHYEDTMVDDYELLLEVLLEEEAAIEVLVKDIRGISNEAQT